MQISGTGCKKLTADQTPAVVEESTADAQAGTIDDDENMILEEWLFG